jgi:hypothetical protein
MDTLFLLIAAALMLMALDIGEEARRRNVRERRMITPLPVLSRLPDERMAPAGAAERFGPGADPWTAS